MPFSGRKFRGFKLTRVTIPSWVTQEEVADYVKLSLDPKYHDIVEELLSDPNLEIVRVEQDKPQGGIKKLQSMRVAALQNAPSFPKETWNFAVAMAQFAIDGFTTVTEDEYRERITICDVCPTARRNGWRCLGCGCILAAKARIRSETCSDGNWPILDTKTSEEKSV